MSKDYFFSKDNQQTGPFDLEVIKKMITEGKITSKSLAWCEGMENWKPAGQIEELSLLFKSRVQPAASLTTKSDDTSTAARYRNSCRLEFF